MSRCDIVIPVWNQLEDTRGCIASIERNTSYPYRLIIIDNGSNYETRRYLEDLKKHNASIALVRNEKNQGFIKAVNEGIRLSTADYVCILNNDTLVTPGWLKESVNIFDKDPLIGIVNPSSNTLGQRLPEGRTPDGFAGDMKHQSGLFVELGNAFGFCMLIKKRLFDEIGLFDEIYGMGNFEDTDFSMRAKRKGYKPVRALASYVYHKESNSFDKLSSFKRDFEKNRRIFESKWGKIRRIMVVFREINPVSLRHLKNILNEYAKGRSWVYIISPVFETKEFFEKFSNLTFCHFKNFFYLLAFLKISFKKKRPDIIYANNPFFLKLAKLSTGAEVRKIG